MQPSRLLIIYTGGTIGMVENPHTGALEAMDFQHISKHVPEMDRFPHHIDSITFGPPIDSSDMQPRYWERMVEIIVEGAGRYDGFVLLHGTDTMVYTASALSFMLSGLNKPVIITGSQLPIGQLRTDGKENFLTAIEIAAERRADGSPMVPEVCIFFENELMRGNRCTKINAEGFHAFRSHNLHPLAHAGIHLRYREDLIRTETGAAFTPRTAMDARVVVLRLFPGITPQVVEALLSIPDLRGVVLQSYGAGNAPRDVWFAELITQCTARGVVVVNTTQCAEGAVDMGRYETSLQLLKAGVVNGRDMTVECVVTKLMFLLANLSSPAEVAAAMERDLAGELTQA